MQAPSAHLVLEVIAGPATAPFRVLDGRTITIGRSSECELLLQDDRISRKHCVLHYKGDSWRLVDLSSRHGTSLNGTRIAPHDPVVLANDDIIGVGPCALRARVGDGQFHDSRLLDDSPNSTMRVEHVSDAELAHLAEHRLNLLLRCSELIHSADSERKLAYAALRSVLEGSGFPRAAIIRQLGSPKEVELLAHLSADGSTSDALVFSRSLIAAASQGNVVRLTSENNPLDIVSIQQLGIHTAICAPIMLGESPVAYLYLDARESESHTNVEAAGFCMGIARMCGLALANLKRIDLEFRHKRVQDDLQIARHAQIQLAPAQTAIIGPVQYSVRLMPGQSVAGDLFDVVPISDDRTAVFVGDVTGGGIGSAILMAATQSFLHSTLHHTQDPGQAVMALNRFISARSVPSQFVSLWLGIFDRTTRLVCFVDAGHGHWLHIRDGMPIDVGAEGGFLVGIDQSAAYHTEQITLGPADRIFLYSDGITEQRNLDREEFGRDRLIDTLRQSAATADDVSRTIAAVEQFIGRSRLDDDATIASIAWADHPT